MALDPGSTNSEPDQRAKTLKRLNVIGVIAIADALLLAVLLYASVTDSDLVHVLGPIHGVGFLILVALCARGAGRGTLGLVVPPRSSSSPPARLAR